MTTEMFHIKFSIVPLIEYSPKHSQHDLWYITYKKMGFMKISLDLHVCKNKALHSQFKRVIMFITCEKIYIVVGI